MKAVCLFSGGLDSRLALRLIAAQGVEVIALHFIIPFALKKESRAREMFS
ncbi:MAG: 7-cyano-7-deazaguanine synthase, partial [Candidatus Omnitrophica bacterium]|nr:7-cyano-7-deazaguanine synthase [Candidatus Omnitrophota bacterium]